uniref:S1 motif domain-containing protein n=1 Tax=Arundo donax TaxID=35708 RepID=A0A0A9FX67_ARUDO
MPPVEGEAGATTPSRGTSRSESWSPAPRRASTSRSAPTASPRCSPRSSSRSTAAALTQWRERPLLFRRLAWHRAMQIMQLDEPIEVKIYEWNTGGLLTRIEGLRAFLPKFEFMDRINTFMDLKNKVGCSILVCIVKLDEETNDLVISEKRAWEMTCLKEGTLLQGTIRKIFPYGAQVRIAGTNRSGLLHISNISRGRVLSVSDILKIDDEVKVLVIKSNVADKIALSTADLESIPGLFLSDKAKVFSEAEEMAQRYREQLPVISQNAKSDDDLPGETIPFDDEAKLYANWKWFKFLQHGNPVDNQNGT